MTTSHMYNARSVLFSDILDGRLSFKVKLQVTGVIRQHPQPALGDVFFIREDREYNRKC